MSSRSVLVTGARGYIGRQLIEALAQAPGNVSRIVSADVRETPAAERLPDVVYVALDVRDPGVAKALREHAVDTVVHLAAIVTPGPASSRELEYEIDVGGTRNVLEACLAAGVRKLIVTSSGAAYGYHADNPVPLGEDAPLRGNREFAYSDHKRQVEELLAEARSRHPELAQLVLRPGAILGERVDNQITALFEKPVVLGVVGSEGPFSFVWDQDVVACLLRGVHEDASGVYNLAGDGCTPLREIARRLGKPYLPLPAWLLRRALAVLHRLGLSRYGPEQVMFLQYRPVLSNERLKHELGYQPRLSSDAAFERWVRSRSGASGDRPRPPA